MKNLRMFEIRFYGPTNKKGSKVRIRDTRFNDIRFITLRATQDSCSEGVEFLTSLGIPLVGQSWDETKYLSYLLTDNFNKRIKK